MDEDPVLRTLGEQLARDDPRLAALLGDPSAVPRRRGSRTLLALLVLAPLLITAALLLSPTVVVGVTAMVLAAASPLVVYLMCAGDRPRPAR